jgi:hypothetical protein
MSPALFGIGLASVLLLPVLSGFALAEIREYRRQRALREGDWQRTPAPRVATAHA